MNANQNPTKSKKKRSLANKQKGAQRKKDNKKKRLEGVAREVGTDRTVVVGMVEPEEVDYNWMRAGFAGVEITRTPTVETGYRTGLQERIDQEGIEVRIQTSFQYS